MPVQERVELKKLNGEQLVEVLDTERSKYERGLDLVLGKVRSERRTARWFGVALKRRLRIRTIEGEVFSRGTLTLPQEAPKP